MSTPNRKNKGDFKKGHPGYWLGKKRPDITGKNNPHYGKNRSGENSYSWKGGLPSCIDCSKVLSVRGYKFCHRCAVKGDRAPNWKGGITSLNIGIRSLFEYRQWRSDIFTRDNYICNFCGIRGGKLHVDHIKPFSLILQENKIKNIRDALICEELWDTNNGRTLCFKCHKKTDTWGGFTKFKKNY